jgi:hypothetical protein
VSQRVSVRIDRHPPSLRLVSRGSLIFRASEPGSLVVAVNGRWRRVRVRRAGLVHLSHRGAVRGVTAYEVDLAGNRSRAISSRR